MRRIALALVMLVPGVVSAQGGFELIPFGGYRWGGEVAAQDVGLDWTRVDVDSSEVLGVALEVALGPGLRLQLLADRQSTRFVDESVGGRTIVLGDVDVTYYHLGLLYQWNPGRVRPYVGGSLGLATLEPDAPELGRTDELSGSIAGGFKVYLSDHFGVRVELRSFWTNLDHDGWDWDVSKNGCPSCNAAWDDDLFQTELTVGLVLSF